MFWLGMSCAVCSLNVELLFYNKFTAYRDLSGILKLLSENFTGVIYFFPLKLSPLKTVVKILPTPVLFKIVSWTMVLERA